ncbi:MAG: ATPase [Spirochaetes bacterium]|nr:MAG: ATPase [Spirochaetota bacterium]
MIFSVIVLFVVLTVVSIFAAERIFAQESQTKEGTTEVSQNNTGSKTVAGYAFIGAAIAFGFGAIGAGIGIGNVGAAAMGAIAEKPEIAGQALIFVALAEGLVIFGFITALMILGKV